MTHIIKLPEIKEKLRGIDPIKAIAEGFIAYSQGKVVVPPVGEMIFEDPPGDAHIKYGFIKNDNFYVVKIAAGFYDNPKKGLPPNNGLMLLFNQKTGAIECILLDEGYLTNVRTASAGAVAAKYLAPKNVTRIGVFGTGIQGHMQVQYLNTIIECKDVIAWDIDDSNLTRYKTEMEAKGYSVETTRNASDVASTCNLIITATPATTPVLSNMIINKGTHITAMGSDTSEKNELEPGILKRADIVVADSISQCMERGEIYQAIRAGVLDKDRVVELGNVISGKSPRRTSDNQITVTDLTGVAVQDIQIAKAIFLKRDN